MDAINDFSQTEYDAYEALEAVHKRVERQVDNVAKSGAVKRFPVNQLAGAYMDHRMAKVVGRDTLLHDGVDAHAELAIADAEAYLQKAAMPFTPVRGTNRERLVENLSQRGRVRLRGRAVGPEEETRAREITYQTRTSTRPANSTFRTHLEEIRENGGVELDKHYLQDARGYKLPHAHEQKVHARSPGKRIAMTAIRAKAKRDGVKAPRWLEMETWSHNKVLDYYDDFIGTVKPAAGHGDKDANIVDIEDSGKQKVQGYNPKHGKPVPSSGQQGKTPTVGDLLADGGKKLEDAEGDTLEGPKKKTKEDLFEPSMPGKKPTKVQPQSVGVSGTNAPTAAPDKPKTTTPPESPATAGTPNAAPTPAGSGAPKPTGGTATATKPAPTPVETDQPTGPVPSGDALKQHAQEKLTALGKKYDADEFGQDIDYGDRPTSTDLKTATSTETERAIWAKVAKTGEFPTGEELDDLTDAVFEKMSNIADEAGIKDIGTHVNAGIKRALKRANNPKSVKTKVEPKVEAPEAPAQEAPAASSEPVAPKSTESTKPTEVLESPDLPPAQATKPTAAAPKTLAELVAYEKNNLKDNVSSAKWSVERVFDKLVARDLENGKFPDPNDDSSGLSTGAHLVKLEKESQQLLGLPNVSKNRIGNPAKTSARNKVKAHFDAKKPAEDGKWNAGHDKELQSLLGQYGGPQSLMDAPKEHKAKIKQLQDAKQMGMSPAKHDELAVKPTPEAPKASSPYAAVDEATDKLAAFEQKMLDKGNANWTQTDLEELALLNAELSTTNQKAKNVADGSVSVDMASKFAARKARDFTQSKGNNMLPTEDKLQALADKIKPEVKDMLGAKGFDPQETAGTPDAPVADAVQAAPEAPQSQEELIGAAKKAFAATKKLEGDISKKGDWSIEELKELSEANAKHIVAYAKVDGKPIDVEKFTNKAFYNVQKAKEKTGYGQITNSVQEAAVLNSAKKYFESQGGTATPAEVAPANAPATPAATPGTQPEAPKTYESTKAGADAANEKYKAAILKAREDAKTAGTPQAAKQIALDVAKARLEKTIAEYQVPLTHMSYLTGRENAAKFATGFVNGEVGNRFGKKVPKFSVSSKFGKELKAHGDKVMVEYSHPSAGKLNDTPAPASSVKGSSYSGPPADVIPTSAKKKTEAYVATAKEPADAAAQPKKSAEQWESETQDELTTVLAETKSGSGEAEHTAQIIKLATAYAQQKVASDAAGNKQLYASGVEQQIKEALKFAGMEVKAARGLDKTPHVTTGSPERMKMQSDLQSYFKEISHPNSEVHTVSEISHLTPDNVSASFAAKISKLGPDFLEGANLVNASEYYAITKQPQYKINPKSEVAKQGKKLVHSYVWRNDYSSGSNSDGYPSQTETLGKLNDDQYLVDQPTGISNTIKRIGNSDFDRELLAAPIREVRDYVVHTIQQAALTSAPTAQDITLTHASNFLGKDNEFDPDKWKIGVPVRSTQNLGLQEDASWNSSANHVFLIDIPAGSHIVANKANGSLFMSHEDESVLTPGMFDLVPTHVKNIGTQHIIRLQAKPVNPIDPASMQAKKAEWKSQLDALTPMEKEKFKKQRQEGASKLQKHVSAMPLEDRKKYQKVEEVVEATPALRNDEDVMKALYGLDWEANRQRLLNKPETTNETAQADEQASQVSAKERADQLAGEFKLQKVLGQGSYSYNGDQTSIGEVTTPTGEKKKVLHKTPTGGAAQEVVAARIGDAVGMGEIMPVVSEGEDGSSRMEFIEGGQSVADLFGNSGSVRKTAVLDGLAKMRVKAGLEPNYGEALKAATSELAMVRAFDYLTANDDRARWNLFVTPEGRLKTIDNGMMGRGNVNQFAPFKNSSDTAIQPRLRSWYAGEQADSTKGITEEVPPAMLDLLKMLKKSDLDALAAKLDKADGHTGKVDKKKYQQYMKAQMIEDMWARVQHMVQTGQYTTGEIFSGAS